MSNGMYILKAPIDMKYAIGRTDTASRTIAASGPITPRVYNGQTERNIAMGVYPTSQRSCSLR